MLIVRFWEKDRRTGGRTPDWNQGLSVPKRNGKLVIALSSTAYSQAARLTSPDLGQNLAFPSTAPDRTVPANSFLCFDLHPDSDLARDVY